MNLLDSVTRKLKGAVKESATVISWNNPANVRFVFTLLPEEPVIGSFPSEEAVLVEFEGRSEMVSYCKLTQRGRQEVRVFIPTGEEGMQWNNFYYKVQKGNQMFHM
ncbi:hypothetical protein CF115_06200 [Aeromonas veronii]|uniref:hypothetical protein n=1 Tax=Aeromonas veronii TaxID=654 RepID=UPI0011173BFA|nr:hypothetical protein [Aeromonas veronii]TNJ09485.1 hypothetical protein CF115_06200 [Aeromonas veronii]